MGTWSDTDEDVLKEILGDVNSNGFTVDRGTSANAIMCSEFPDIYIT